MKAIYKIITLLIFLESMTAIDCTDVAADKPTKLDYHADTAVIKSQLISDGYSVHSVEFVKNTNGYYVLSLMVETKGNYDKEVLDAYTVMYDHGVADYYLVGIADYELQSAWSFSSTRETLGGYFSGTITEEEYINRVDAQPIM
ncbi:hypothetical protein [Methanococcoides alaskense]|uniref:Uncharacterized protein n=1 Tax=Methanococcoides alaskense TaxID=325778 RepID=A0AA90Z9Q0_9EURY|nr:hypothetical protein [Methanococcoides alaskense]MDA0525607.1 hypothetical protein [Methanococcoides alaskense]MDR6223521.1 hypothetical protein [Methanococcoides alaskense]